MIVKRTFIVVLIVIRKDIGLLNLMELVYRFNECKERV